MEIISADGRNHTISSLSLAWECSLIARLVYGDREGLELIMLLLYSILVERELGMLSHMMPQHMHHGCINGVGFDVIHMLTMK